MSLCSKNGFGSDITRRTFLSSAGIGFAGTMLVSPMREASALPAGRNEASVSFVTGTSRREMVKQALEPFRKEIETGIAGRQIIVKVNMADKIGPLSNTHPDAIRGLLDFLKPMYDKKITVAECTLTEDGFGTLCGQYGYHPLKSEYNIDFVELHNDSTKPMFILGKNLHPLKIEILDTFTDPENYIISLTPPKIHDVVVATAGLKNIIMASPKNIKGVSSKYSMHGNGPWWLNYNLFTLAQRIRPHFTIIDGLEGMEGDGPIHGTKVDHKFALAGPDVIAVDRIALDLMGIDIDDVGYLTYCGQAGIGVSDRERIKIIGGDKPENHVIEYKKHKAFKYQLYWKKDVELVGWNPKDLPY